MNKLITTKEMKEIYGVCTQTLMRWRQAGLPHVKLNERNFRYDLQEVKEWFENKNKIVK